MAPDTDTVGSAVGLSQRSRRLVPWTAQLVTAAVLGATLLSAVGRTSWLAELATHFPWQYAAAALAAAVALAWHRRAAPAMFAVVLAAANVYLAWPDAEPGPRHIQGQRFRVVVSNVFFGNSEYERVVAFVRRARPDAVVFAEVTPEWRTALRALENELPHTQFTPGLRHGVLVMSRWPAVVSETVPLGPDSVPFVHTRLDVAGRQLDLYGVHTDWPLGGHNAGIRNRQLSELGTLAARAGDAVVVAGDLNVTRHSPYFSDLLARGGLRPASRGAWTPTWPTFFPPAGIQIDHVLVSGKIGTTAFEVGPRVGSDHRPIVADLVLGTATADSG
jgi:endonuclease/exonuclease/phosphatase (EEP) superfamily protein YafD